MQWLIKHKMYDLRPVLRHIEEVMFKSISKSFFYLIYFFPHKVFQYTH